MRLLIGFPLAALLWLGFYHSSEYLQEQPRLERETEHLRVRLPVPVQLLYSAGDNYSAANANVFRGLMVTAAVTEAETYRVQGQLQRDAAWLNPWHEDNYYVGAAILPWNGQVAAGQYVLHHAARARSWDMWPAFFYAFNAMYFEHDMNRAAEWAERAALRNARNAPALRSMAAAWYERGDDPDIAIRILQAMHAEARDANFKLLLEARVQRLEGLKALRGAAAAYQEATGQAANNLTQLIGYAGLQALPVDPLQVGYRVDARGVPQLADHAQAVTNSESN
ncbi:hypothetical protein SAMN05216214_11371 [Atopomonas hussainii]|uniref:Tetratricopeptide repeat protein n=1 Tax=Atopomonas hussainii TaxID=1429083 RepID=A0A1H7QU80_9GAMM|nr:hypothetical protein [Atopomonas hussainii]SEL51439.1 hypothetical protein SAMN05216214_11371 [Atopomonas hussainii]